MSQVKKFDNILKNIEKSNVLLVGDVILDTFVYGQVARISPEGPVPVLAACREHEMLGGAGNVFANLRNLKANVDLIGLIGKDSAGEKIQKKIIDSGMAYEGLIVDKERPTIQKTRYQARSQQLLRVDYEKMVPLTKALEDKLKEAIKNKIETSDCVILSDYGKGVLSDELISFTINLAKKNKIPVIVDPKGTDYRKYKGVSLVTPNRSELSDATNKMPTKTNEDVLAAAHHLIKSSGVKGVLATRSEDGMTLIENKKSEPYHLATKALEVYDVSGAGDTVVATVSAVLAAKGTMKEAAYLANIAGGLVVAKIGTATVQPRELLQAVEEFEQEQSELNAQKRSNFQARFYEWDDALKQIQIWQDDGLKVGFTNGCFDILHYGHVNYLNQARGEVDRLVVGLNHDRSVKILKGAERPINDEKARASVLGALGCVDMVVLFGASKDGDDNTPCDVVGYLKPDLLMKGGDYQVADLPEAQVAFSYGGDVKIMPLYEGYSTTGTIEKMRK